MTDPTPNDEPTTGYDAPPLTFERSETDAELAAIPDPAAAGLIPIFTPSTTGDTGGNS